MVPIPILMPWIIYSGHISLTNLHDKKVEAAVRVLFVADARDDALGAGHVVT